ncbi:MAG: hypothetical protein JEZ09_10070 [Salinivirgaceae bacterium]|nr:hypothetical protein [Salinivirgaceae bacterium]
MFRLNEEQVGLISSDVENEGINYSHLSYDLIDHICCDIESHMSQGISFNQAYSKVKEEFGIKGLRQIQQDTLMLIDKNYRIMKKSMKMIGVLAMSLMAFGALFKIFHWPGAAPMLAISFFFTTLVFFPTLLYVMYKEVNQKKQGLLYLTAFIGGAAFMTGVLFKIMHWPEGDLLIFFGIILISFLLIPMIIILRVKKLSINRSVFLTGLISLMVFLFGFIFKMQHWPGANILKIFGSVLLIMVFIPLFYYKEIRKSDKMRVDFIFGIIALTYFIVLSFLLAISQNYSVLMEFGVFEKSYRQNAISLELNNQKIEPSKKDEALQNFINQATILFIEIEELKITIIQHHNNINREMAIELIKSNKPLVSKNAVTNFLLSEQNHNTPLQKLKTEIDKFNNLYYDITNDSINSYSKPTLFDTDNIQSDKGLDQSWENYHFYQKPSIATLSLLSLWQYNIRLTENNLLTALVNNPKPE